MMHVHRSSHTRFSPWANVPYGGHCISHRCFHPSTREHEATAVRFGRCVPCQFYDQGYALSRQRNRMEEEKFALELE
jgi:hypothetical protein